MASRGRAGGGRFRAASRAFLAERQAKDRKANGQYLTPAPVRGRLLDCLQIEPEMRVLDPGVGTGEFLLDVVERCPSAEVFGHDVDPLMVSICREQGLSGVTQRDVLREGTDEGFDLVVGNPPFGAESLRFRPRAGCPSRSEARTRRSDAAAPSSSALRCLRARSSSSRRCIARSKPQIRSQRKEYTTRTRRSLQSSSNTSPLRCSSSSRLCSSRSIPRARSQRKE